MIFALCQLLSNLEVGITQKFKLVRVPGEVRCEIKCFCKVGLVDAGQKSGKDLHDLKNVHNIIELPRDSQDLIRYHKRIIEQTLCHGEFKLDQPFDQEIGHQESLIVKSHDVGLNKLFGLKLGHAQYVGRQV